MLAHCDLRPESAADLRGLRMPRQDPETLEKLEAHTKNESFVARMQELAANPKFAAAAGGYVEEMAQELAVEAEEGGADFGAVDEEEDEEDEEDEEELDEEDDEEEDEV